LVKKAVGRLGVEAGEGGEEGAAAECGKGERGDAHGPLLLI